MNSVASGAKGSPEGGVSGEIVDFAGERCYVIRGYDQMPPFMVSLVSGGDHWLFLSSTGGLTAGRVSPESALFPYVTVDKLHDAYLNTGGKTLVRAQGQALWEPFNRERGDIHEVTRNFYKTLTGHKVYLEEVNHTLGLTFRQGWATCDEYGFVRSCELLNQGGREARLDLCDGVQNLLPAGVALHSQTNTSYLVDAYKLCELDPVSGLALYTLYSAISDRAEPRESLRANTVFHMGLAGAQVSLGAESIEALRRGVAVKTTCKADDGPRQMRGKRGAYFVAQPLTLPPGGAHAWQIVMNVEQSGSSVSHLQTQLAQGEDLAQRVAAAVAQDADELRRLLASGDAMSLVGEEGVAAHHLANVTYNLMRGGVFVDQYRVSRGGLQKLVAHANRELFQRHEAALQSLPSEVSVSELAAQLDKWQDPQLQRLAMEYLPLTFGRRHGDPSRPWNMFAIHVRDDEGARLVSYQGNWRDIFQNWEALAFSYPLFIEAMVAKFVNASTLDGHNPYRITSEGIDWEVEEADDPWSNIGYWGDHQVVYLLRLLDLAERFHPGLLGERLRQRRFSYANVPYRIKPLADLIQDPANGVAFDAELAARIDERVSQMGADGKLVLDGDGQVHLATLGEKLLVPLLAKLGNLVAGGGIWLTTQRPEWNDANNALAGGGLSMVTLYHLHRYVMFLERLFAPSKQEQGGASRHPLRMAAEVADWLDATTAALQDMAGHLDGITDAARLECLVSLGTPYADYRARVYAGEGFSGATDVSVASVMALLAAARAVILHGIRANLGEGGLYHAYNVADFSGDALGVVRLYPMVEGQVAALSSGALTAADAVSVVDSLFASDMHRADLDTFMLYPDRAAVPFLERNRFPAKRARQVPLLSKMLDDGDERLVQADADGQLRFHPDLVNAAAVTERLAEIAPKDDGQAVLELFEEVFNHLAFTGRSGGMFAFEGLGSVYWHMVAKLLLAVQEHFFEAHASGEDATLVQRLGEHYYRVRAGLGFNKTPAEYGAFPLDPYSHTPGHAGAQQPGMTGQVKEEVLTRFGELGLCVSDGCASFNPALLRAREFTDEAHTFRYLDVGGEWRTLELEPGSLAFTWCQTPIVYRLREGEPSLVVAFADGGDAADTAGDLVLNAPTSAELFARTGKIREIHISIPPGSLFGD